MMNSTLAHVCPVCNSTHIKTDWETTDEHRNWWWTGHYACLSCLTIYQASGSIRMGELVMHTWHPACRIHGTDAVVISEQDGLHFYCVKCGRKLEVRDGKVVVTWQPQVKTRAQSATPAASNYRTVFWGVTNTKRAANQ